MDKKSKKKLEVLRDKIRRLQQQLSGAKAQPDEVGEVERLTAEIEGLEKQVEQLKNS